MVVKKRTESAAPRNALAERILALREGKELSLERLEAELGDASRYDIVASLKGLEKGGQGQFLAGRKGQKSRFVWGARKTATALAPPEPTALAARAKPAKPLPDKPVGAKPVGAKPLPGAHGLARKTLAPADTRLERAKLSEQDGRQSVSRISRRLQHSFHLRPGVQVSLDLPEDLTATEVDRFCSFLKALPFARHR
jgi:hypothetical protein